MIAKLILSKIALASMFLFMTMSAEASISNKYKKKPSKRPDKTVGVPLDGGLLALLAGGGVAYFAARNRRNKA